MSPAFCVLKLEMHTPPTPLERGGEVLANLTMGYGDLIVTGVSLARDVRGPFLILPRFGNNRRVVIRCPEAKAQLVRAAHAAYCALSERAPAETAGRDGSPDDDGATQ